MSLDIIYMTHRPELDTESERDRPAIELENEKLREALAGLISNFEDLEESASLAARRSRDLLRKITRSS